MLTISVEELTNYKILPYDLFNGEGNVIASSGEPVTPGLLLKLRYISAIYVDNVTYYKHKIQVKEEAATVVEEEITVVKQETQPAVTEEKEISPKREPEPVISKEAEQEQEDEFLDYEIPEFENETCCLPVESQVHIKTQFKKALHLALNESMDKCKDVYCNVRDQIVEETLSAVNDIIYKSQLKVYGDYNYTHGINVSMMSTLLAHKLKLNETQIKDVALAAMLHDIGKTRIPEELVGKTVLTAKEAKLLQLHPQIGYRIIRREMGLAEHIALVALEHHEKNDGSGYPYGISGDLISMPSQIVMICDAFDNLVSNRGMIKVKNGKEAMRILLEQGSKWFTPNILYTFIYMSNYNDTLPI